MTVQDTVMVAAKSTSKPGSPGPPGPTNKPNPKHSSKGSKPSGKKDKVRDPKLAVTKPKTKNAKAVPHKDQYQRMSFLYQAASAMAADPRTEVFARLYAQTMKATAKKSVLRL